MRGRSAMTPAPSSRRRSRRLVLAFTAASAAALWLLLRLAFSLPDDAELLRRLSADQGSFAGLLALAQADPGLTSVDLSEVRPASSGLSAERVERYRALLARCELRALAREGGEVELVAAAMGSGGRALVKGFVRPRAAPSPLVPSLDAFAKKAPPGARAFRPAGGGWYLFVAVR